MSASSPAARRCRTASTRVAGIKWRGQPVVVCQLRTDLGVDGESASQRLGHRGVQSDPFSHRQVAVDRIPYEGVAEPVAPITFGEQTGS